jgi:hypothetical protein
VQKYKKLRTAYHKQALLHLAGQTSLRWYRLWRCPDVRGNFVVYLLTLCQALFLRCSLL